MNLSLFFIENMHIGGLYLVLVMLSEFLLLSLITQLCFSYMTNDV